MVPPFSISSLLSSMANTRFEAIIPICKVLNLSAICLIGRNNCCENCMYKKILPRSYSESFTSCIPPNHTISAIVTETAKSLIGKKIELYHIVFSHARLCFSFICRKRSCSCCSSANSCNTFIPDIRSCTNEFKLATSWRTSTKAAFIER